MAGAIVITTGLNPRRYTQIIAVRILNIEGFLYSGETEDSAAGGKGGGGGDGWIGRFLIWKRGRGGDLRTAADGCWRAAISWWIIHPLRQISKQGTVSRTRRYIPEFTRLSRIDSVWCSLIAVIRHPQYTVELSDPSRFYFFKNIFDQSLRYHWHPY